MHQQKKFVFTVTAQMTITFTATKPSLTVEAPSDWRISPCVTMFTSLNNRYRRSRHLIEFMQRAHHYRGPAASYKIMRNIRT